MDEKGWRTMHSSLPNTTHPLPTPAGNGSLRKRPTEDLVYQVVTVAAILIVLGSLWVF
jgi:hypothetical protein